MFVRIRSTLLAALLLAGCANPQSAEEFRQTTRAEKREVNRPLPEVAAALRSRAPECLNATVRRKIPGPTYHVVDVTYKPTVVVTDRKAELRLQMQYTRGVVNVVQAPEGGYYVLVADVYPVDSKRSRAEIFAPAAGYEAVVRALTGWVTGKDVGCPDMSKVG